jgi:hypothetical protein
MGPCDKQGRHFRPFVRPVYLAVEPDLNLRLLAYVLAPNLGKSIYL